MTDASASSLKVLHVITGLDGGGAERMLNRLATGLRVRGLWSVVVPIVPHGRIEQEFISNGIRVASLGIARKGIDPRALARLFRITRRERPDILQTWLYHADFLGTIAHLIGFRRTPLVWNIRCGVFDTSQYSRTLTIVRRLLVAMSSLPAAIITNSAQSRDEHIAIGYAPDRWHVIPNGIDTARFRPRRELRSDCRAQFGIPEGARVVGTVGRVDALKDYPNFLDAAAIIHRQAPDVVYVMAGQGLSYANDSFSAEVDRRGLRDAIVLLGEVSDVAHLYPAFDIFCLSSSSESFPNVLVEALACGIPSVSTDVGAAAEIIREGGNIVPPRDAAALAAATLALLNLPQEQLREKGLRARKRIEVDYSLDAIVMQYERLYRGIAASRP